MTTRRIVFATAAVVLACQLTGGAQIERLDLAQMVAKSDNALVAQIVAKRVTRIDDPIDGPELYFTTLTLKGQSLRDGSAVQVDVSFPGGFVDETHGVHNSEAPAADDVRIGNQVVAFYKWSDNLGGGLAANALYASHGGIYRTVQGADGLRVLGRGEGYAIDKNLRLADLETSVRSLSGGK